MNPVSLIVWTVLNPSSCSPTRITTLGYKTWEMVWKAFYRTSTVLPASRNVVSLSYKVMRLMRHDLSVVYLYWLLMITALSFMCPEECFKRSHSMIFPEAGWCWAYFTFPVHYFDLFWKWEPSWNYEESKCKASVLLPLELASPTVMMF